MAFRGRGGDFFSNVEPLFPRGKGPSAAGFTPSRGTRRILYVVGALVLLLVILKPLVGFYTDLLWYRSLGYEQLFLTRFQYQGWLALVAFAVAFIALGASSTYAVRQVGFRALSAIGVRRGVLSGALGKLVIMGAAVVAALMGLAASAAWEDVAKALNSVAFNRTDPLFGQDLGFYVFQLPAYRFAWGWLLALLVICFGAALFIYLSAASSGELPPRALGHLSILATAFFLLLAAHYRLAMFDLLLGKNGFVFGAGYTDVNVRLPMDWVMLGLTLGLAVLAMANAFLRRRTVLIAAGAGWLLGSLVLLVVAPAVVQRFTVAPAEFSQERAYIQREIDATNQAYGLDRMAVTDFTDKQTLSQDVVARNAGTIGNVRLWDYGPLQTAYNQIQTIRSYYDFQRIAIDRYTLSDGYQQLMLAARELSPGKLPDTARTWVNVHLGYTHGYGAAATRVSRVQGGQPDLVLSGIPPVGEPALDRPQVYFGESTTDYVIAASKEPEVDYEKGSAQVYSRWTGTHGVQMSSGLRRLAYAYQLGDLNLLLSSQVSSDSQLLYRRDVSSRLTQLAPFLTFDKDPYIVVSGGRLYWMVDAYTTADGYPYSRPRADTGHNYIRNSVKVVMDAYEGTVTFYVADPSDPVIATYQRIFPGAFSPIGAMPTDLRRHIRYPVDLFSIQSEVLQSYHMHNPQDFYKGSDTWTQPRRATEPGAAPTPLEPYYVVMKLPGQTSEEFVLIQPFTPLNRKNMVAWLAARSDGADYGKLSVFRFPTDRQITGPEQVQSKVDQDPVITAQLSLLNQNGSKVIRGNLLVIPIEDSILFVEPIYIVSTGNPNPELRKVVVGDEQRVVWANSLDEALQLLTSGAGSAITNPNTPSNPGPTPTPSASPSPGATDVAGLVTRANALYADAQAKLKAGDFAGYASDIQQLGQVLEQLRAATNR